MSKLRKKTKEEEKERLLKEREEYYFDEENTIDLDAPDISKEYQPDRPAVLTTKEDQEANELVARLLQDKLGEHSYLVQRYLEKTVKRNLMNVDNTARASIRYGISPTATAAIASGFLQDLIAAGHLSKEYSHLACDQFKISRARKHQRSEVQNSLKIPTL